MIGRSSWLLLLLLPACGLGTEIGNGAKPDDAGKRGDGAADDSEMVEELPTEASQGNPDGVQSSVSTDADQTTGTGTETDTDVNGPTGTGVGDSSDIIESGAIVAGWGFGAELLVAECGSPFSVADSGAVLLANSDASMPDLVAQFDPERNHWTIGSSVDPTLAVAAMLSGPVVGSFEVDARNGDGSDFVSTATCGDPLITESVTFDGLSGAYQKVYQTLHVPSGDFAVTWYRDGTRLVAIEIARQADEGFTTVATFVTEASGL